MERRKPLCLCKTSLRHVVWEPWKRSRYTNFMEYSNDTVRSTEYTIASSMAELSFFFNKIGALDTDCSVISKLKQNIAALCATITRSRETMDNHCFFLTAWLYYWVYSNAPSIKSQSLWLRRTLYDFLPNHLNIHSARSPLFQGFQGTNSSIQCQILIIPWNSFYFQLKSDKFHRFAEPRLLIGQSSGRRPHIETRNSLEPPELSPNEGTIIFRKLVTP